jgi:hypothetical protein
MGKTASAFIERDTRQTLRLFSDLANKEFTTGDLFITIRLVGIDKADSYIKSKLSALSSRVTPSDRERARRIQSGNPNIKAIAVYVSRDRTAEIHPHCHILLKDVEFTHATHQDFIGLIKHHLNKDRLPGDVVIKRINDVGRVVQYALMEQGECSVELYHL